VTVAPEVTPEETASSQTIHTVTAGQNLLIIAQMYGVTQQEIADANNIGVDDILSIDQELIIPVDNGTVAPVVHAVTAGENLLIIARTYGVTQQEIADANGIDVDDILSIGQELTIPVTTNEGETAATAEPTTTPIVAQEQSTVHVVTSGEYIELIAAQYNVSVDDLLAANGLTSESLLSVGQELVIPTEGTIATSTPEPTTLPTLTSTPQSVAGIETYVQEDNLDDSEADAELSNSVNYVYTRPYLLGPVDGTTFMGEDATIVLNWTSSGILQPYEWYLVRIWPSDIEEEEVEIWTQATSARLSKLLRPTGDGKEQLLWQVTVVSRYSEAEIGTPLSPSSVSRTINWY